MVKTKLRAENDIRADKQKGIAVFSDRSLCAGMTVEAALVLPLFLFFIFNVVFLLDVVRLQSRVTAALQQTGDKICEYAWYREYAAGGESSRTQGSSQGGIPEEAGEILSAVYAAGAIRSQLGSDYMNNTCLRGGSAGISCMQSKILSGNDIIEINADYRTRPFIPILCGPDFKLRSTYYGHAWTGYEPGNGTSDGAAQSGDTDGTGKVIVAEYGEVYHTDPNCSYLNPRIREVDASELSSLRANDGSIYHPCESCHPSKHGRVYITPDGNRFHNSRSCPGIVRTTHEETAEHAMQHLRPCPKCGHEH